MAQKTDIQLTQEAEVIKNETQAGANTATRIGNMLIDVIDSKINISGGGGGGGVPSVNGETGAITLVGGNDITISVTDPNEITIQNRAFDYVASINGLSGDVTQSIDNILDAGNTALNKTMRVDDDNANVDLQIGQGSYVHINRNASPVPQTKVSHYYGTQWYYQGGGSYERYVGIRQDVREVEDNIYNYLPEQSGWLATRNLPYKGAFTLSDADSIAVSDSGIYIITYTGSGINVPQISFVGWVQNGTEWEGEEIVLLIDGVEQGGGTINLTNMAGLVIGNPNITSNGMYRVMKYGTNIYTQR